MRSQKLRRKALLLQLIFLPLLLGAYYLFSKLPYYMINELGYQTWLWALHPVGKYIYIFVWSSIFMLTLVLLELGYYKLRGINPPPKAEIEYEEVKLSLITKIFIGILVCFLALLLIIVITFK